MPTAASNPRSGRRRSAERSTTTTRKRRTTTSPSPNYRITRLNPKKKKHTGLSRAPATREPYDPPSSRLLQAPSRAQRGRAVSDEVLQENARELEGVLQDFGVKGEITNVRPGSRGHTL